MADVVPRLRKLKVRREVVTRLDRIKARRPETCRNKADDNDVNEVVLRLQKLKIKKDVVDRLDKITKEKIYEKEIVYDINVIL